MVKNIKFKIRIGILSILFICYIYILYWLYTHIIIEDFVNHKIDITEFKKEIFKNELCEIHPYQTAMIVPNSLQTDNRHYRDKSGEISYGIKLPKFYLEVEHLDFPDYVKRIALENCLSNIDPNKYTTSTKIMTFIFLSIGIHIILFVLLVYVYIFTEETEKEKYKKI